MPGHIYRLVAVNDNELLIGAAPGEAEGVCIEKEVIAALRRLSDEDLHDKGWFRKVIKSIVENTTWFDQFAVRSDIIVDTFRYEEQVRRALGDVVPLDFLTVRRGENV